MPLNTAVIYHNKGDSADECYTPYYGVDPLLEKNKMSGAIPLALDGGMNGSEYCMDK